MRGLKVAFGLLIVAAVAIWDIGLPGKHTSTADSTPPSSPTASPAAPSATPGVVQPEGKPEFAASFTGSKLDTSVWGTCYPMGMPSGWVSARGCQNFGNKEYEWYLPSQDQVSGGMLHLVAKREQTEGTTVNGSPKRYVCRSGMITSYPGFRFKYGYVQIVAWIPSTNGLWPALWLFPANLRWPPEIDMIESWGNGVYAGSFFHYGTQKTDFNQSLYTPPSQVAGWHIFAVSWTKTQITWLIDGKVTMTVRRRVPQQPMFIIADLADSKIVRGVNHCDGQMLIRSVDVWKA